VEVAGTTYTDIIDEFSITDMPEEDCKVAYEFLTGRRTKPFVVVFGIPKSPKNHHGEETFDQDDPLSNKKRTTSAKLHNGEEYE